jgi:hypothetical protein
MASATPTGSTQRDSTPKRRSAHRPGALLRIPGVGRVADDHGDEGVDLLTTPTDADYQAEGGDARGLSRGIVRLLLDAGAIPQPAADEIGHVRWHYATVEHAPGRGVYGGRRAARALVLVASVRNVD